MFFTFPQLPHPHFLPYILCYTFKIPLYLSISSVFGLRQRCPTFCKVCLFTDCYWHICESRDNSNYFNLVITIKIVWTIRGKMSHFPPSVSEISKFKYLCCFPLNKTSTAKFYILVNIWSILRGPVWEFKNSVKLKAKIQGEIFYILSHIVLPLNSVLDNERE